MMVSARPVRPPVRLGHLRRASPSGRGAALRRIAARGAIVLAVVAVLADPVGDAARAVRARVAPMPAHEPFVVAVADPRAPGDRRAAAQVRRRLARASGVRVRADDPAAVGRLLLDGSAVEARLRVAPAPGFEGAFGSRGLLEAELAIPGGVGRAHRGSIAALALAAVVPATGADARYQAALLRDAVRGLDAARADGRLPAAARAHAATVHPIAAAVLAELSGDVRTMRAAAEGFGRALASPAATPTRRARGAARHNLGVVLAALGARDSGAALLHEAVASHRAALLDRPRDAAPVEWAATQHALGRALAALALRDGGAQAIEPAIEAYRASLTVRTRDGAPEAWAATTADLGRALAARGERDGRAADLEAAAAAYREVLAVHTAERTPFAWAGTQHELGRALVALAEGDGGTRRLREGVAAFRAALTVRTRERVPVAWIETSNELGGALTTLGQREDRREHLQEAAELLGTAVRYHEPGLGPLDPTVSRTNHAAALAALGAYEDGRSLLQTAVGIYEEALLGPMRERDPAAWATTQNNRGLAYLALSPRQTGSVKILGALDSAVAAFERALTVRTPERTPAAWAATQHNLGTALAERGTRRGTAGLRAALAAYDRALQVRTRESMPLAWAATQNGRGLALVALGALEEDEAAVRAAIEAFRQARDVMAAVGATGYIGTIDRNLARAERRRDAAGRGDAARPGG